MLRCLRNLQEPKWGWPRSMSGCVSYFRTQVIRKLSVGHSPPCGPPHSGFGALLEGLSTEPCGSSHLRGPVDSNGVLLRVAVLGTLTGRIPHRRCGEY